MADLTVKTRGKNYVLYNEGVLRIDNVRASYPHLAKPYAGKNNKTDDGQPKTPKFSIIGMLPKTTHVEAKDALKDFINELLKQNDNATVSADKKFLRNGDDHEKETYHGYWTVSASESRRVPVRDRNGVLVDESKIENMIYPGCRVNILIAPWYQDGKTTGAGYGKRVNAGLKGVQFAGDDDRIGGENYIDDSNAWDTGDAESGKSSSSDDDL